MNDKSKLSPNALAFIGLSNEYCHAVEQAADTEREDFVASMTRLLPRIYISAADLSAENDMEDVYYIDDSLDEESYDAVRRGIESVLGEDDTYLEVFEEDMKYSDTPIAASVAEGLSDIYQVLFNFLSAVRDSTEDNIVSALILVGEDFRQYWSRPLCNVLRALNHIRYSQD